MKKTKKKKKLQKFIDTQVKWHDVFFFMTCCQTPVSCIPVLSRLTPPHFHHVYSNFMTSSCEALFCSICYWNVNYSPSTTSCTLILVFPVYPLSGPITCHEYSWKPFLSQQSGVSIWQREWSFTCKPWVFVLFQGYVLLVLNYQCGWMWVIAQYQNMLTMLTFSTYVFADNLPSRHWYMWHCKVGPQL